MKSLSLVRASSQYATAVDSSSLSVTGALTLETWAYFTTLPSLTLEFRGLSGKLGSSAGDSAPWMFYFIKAGGSTVRLGGLIQNAALNDFARAESLAQTLSINTWYHTAFTFDPATTPRTHLYINGIELGYQTHDGTATDIRDTTGDAMVGAIQVSTLVSPSNFWDGNLSNFRIWSVARTQTEINNNKCVVIDSGTNLVASWTLNDTYLDGSGNTNTLTPIASPVFVTGSPITDSSLCLTFVPQAIIM